MHTKHLIHSLLLMGCLALPVLPAVTLQPLTAQNFSNQTDVQWAAVPNHADWLYKTGEQATITVQVLRHGMPQDGLEISYALGQDELDDDTRGTVTLRGGRAEIPVGTMKKPGFRDCRMQCTIDGKTYKNHLKVGFSPEKLQPYTELPSDFQEFWKGVLDEQAKIKMSPVVTYEPRYSNEKVDCYLVKLRTFRQGEYYVYGYLTRPKAEGKYPVVISPPGAGVKPMDPTKTLFYAEQGCIRFDMEIHGIDPSLSAEVYKDITHAFGDHHAGGYLANGITDRDTYYMKRVYAACVRVVDYMTSLPDWDGRNVWVQGGSQGGALTIVLAGLDERVTAASVNHPALSDMAAYAEKGRTGGYPHFGRKYKDVELTKEVIRTLSYYDVVNFARFVKCPVYMTWGFNDNTCPPTTSYCVWNTLTCPKDSLITPINEHWVSTETRYRQLEWFKQHQK
jgi:cephalosporin-C deacetylase-like acetyl esterase